MSSDTLVNTKKEQFEAIYFLWQKRFRAGALERGWTIQHMGELPLG